MSDGLFLRELAGGGLIGVAGAILLLGSGRVAGVSGILGGLVVPDDDDIDWRVAFLAGLAAGGLVLALLAPSVVSPSVVSAPLAAASGVMVGVGTRLAHGCTSGHGVAGISRLSPRSVLATVVFLTAGAWTVGAVRHILGGAA